LPVLLFSVISCFTSGQTNQVTIEGKTYLVYPHQQQVKSMQEYYLNFADRKEVIKRDDRNEKIVSVTEEPLTVLEKKSAIRLPKPPKKYLKDFEQILEFYPYFLITTDNSITVDPTPALVSLPDGDYVMFYRDIPYISKRVLRYKNDIVAAYFSIKNNAIAGSSTWFSPEGKVIKTGTYQNSEKSGVWKMFNYTLKSDTDYKYDPKESLKSRFKNIPYDTSTTTWHFLNGLKNGPYTVYENQELLTFGYYTNDEESGTWETYEFKTNVSIDKKGKLIATKSKEKILIDRHTIRSDKKRGKTPIIRHSVLHYPVMMDSLVLHNSTDEDEGVYDSETGFPDFGSFFEVLEKDTNDLELPEESFTSYEGEELYDKSYDYSNIYYAQDYNPDEHYEVVNGKRYTLNDLIDSIGYLYQYEGIVEHYYKNGQLQYRFEVKDGALVKEEPVYWDNGTIANEVVFVADSNQYVQRFYDYNGFKYYESWHDSKGNILRESQDNDHDFVEINHKKYERNTGKPTVVYSEAKELLSETVPECILLIEELFKVDSSVAKQVYFYPQTRTLLAFERNLSGDTVVREEVIFSEDYLNVNALKTIRFKNLELHTIENGILDEYWKNSISDTLKLEKLAFFWEYKYRRESDHEIWVNGKPFTGNFKLTDQRGNFGVKANDQSIQVTLPNKPADLKLYKAAVKKYIKSGKGSDILQGYISEFNNSGMLSHAVVGLFTHLHDIFLATFDSQPYGLFYSTYDDDIPVVAGVPSRGRAESKISSVEGKYLNGKTEGIWTYKDQFGKIRSTIGYKNGEAHGENLDYSIAYPKIKPKKDSEYNYEYEDPLSPFEEYPQKKTYYPETKCAFKNGALEGPMVQLNWKGDTLSYVAYKDGAKEGVEFKRNKLFYSQSYYQNGFMDGNVKTYFTYPGRDSILIFDLGFKNGMLQGQSIAYHANGKPAKKGFFLNGEPIDDYEAYDTLGFRYQYVKFQYNQPVEEKIWEENELSIRYEFDWRDSISFNFADITESSSIEQLIYQAGYSDYGLYEPYYGRPSLVNKSGIDYNITKYYPNDTIARTGTISKGVKTGCWKYFNYFGKKLMEVEYFDTIIHINDSIRFKSKGILYYLDEYDNPLSKNWIIEKFEKYDCAHTDHNEERMLYCFWEKDTTQHRRNGYVKNYYDNGSIQNEGWVKDGLPTGVWKIYDVNGNLNQVGEYIQGKRNGRWLKGDLGSIKNMSDICLNPNLENLDAILSYQEKLLDVSVITYQMGKELKRKYYGINMNNEDAPEGYYGEETYPEGF
jgi:antitoxin component YwqK of YwqJK toxin-antitoxin module